MIAMNKDVLEAVRKRAFGFSYNEEVLEFESGRVKSCLFCEKRNRLYTRRGFIKVVPEFGENGEIKALKLPKNIKKIKFFVKSKPKQLSFF